MFSPRKPAGSRALLGSYSWIQGDISRSKAHRMWCWPSAPSSVKLRMCWAILHSPHPNLQHAKAPEVYHLTVPSVTVVGQHRLCHLVDYNCFWFNCVCTLVHYLYIIQFNLWTSKHNSAKPIKRPARIHKYRNTQVRHNYANNTYHRRYEWVLTQHQRIQYHRRYVWVLTQHQTIQYHRGYM
jgi:hypothetical protein